MNPKTPRRYQVLPERAVCLTRGCSWHREGPDAEETAHAHAQVALHQTQVTTSATVTFGRIPAGASK